MKSNGIPVLCLLVSFAIGWCGRGMYESYPPRNLVPAEQTSPIQEIVYPELPEGAINDLREN